MATNKHATIRYHALDKCFANHTRKYFIENLIDACNEALYEFTGSIEGVKRRQVYDDIRFMESEQGWSIPLEKQKEGKRVYYRYEDRNFSIKNQAITQSEINQLKETLSILARFKGMPQFEWIDEILVRVESSPHLNKNNTPSIVGFEQNLFLKGLDFFGVLFNAILNKKVLRIEYKSFKNNEAYFMEIHPYFLKQYNNRWFLLGLNPKFQKLSNVALDRIVSFEEVDKSYIENQEYDFVEYFEDAIGVSVDGYNTDRVLLGISKQIWPYIETKPIHGSQKVIERTPEFVIIELQVLLNYELESIILTMGEGMTVLAPDSLRAKIKNRIKAALENYC